MSNSLSPLTTQIADIAIDSALYENSPDCIKILSLDGSIKRLSPGGQVALELDRADQLDGVSWPSLWPGSDRLRVEQAVADAREGKRTQFLASCPTAKNTPRWWDVVVTPLPGSSPTIDGLLAVSRDVTELVEARDALVRANERKNEFLTLTSHELRNPLSALSMAAKLLETFVDSPEQILKVRSMIVRQVEHMSRLAEDLLDISRITRGQVSLQSEGFDLRDAVVDAKEQVEAMVGRKKQVLRDLMPSQPVLVVGDRMRLTQVFGNLIANASRYSPPLSPINVSLMVREGFAVVTVLDKGQGISFDLMPNIFDMYTQGRNESNRSTSGIGMGLAIVKALVDLHGGSIQAESAGVGLGSSFIVKLPLQMNALV